MKSIKEIEGIGPTYAQRFHEIDIFTVEDLLFQGSTRAGRQSMAEKTGISGKLIMKWVNRADLMRLHGVGSEYADLLEISGIDSVIELSHRNAHALYMKMQAVNDEKHLVRHLPSEHQVEEWVDEARWLKRAVEY